MRAFFSVVVFIAATAIFSLATAYEPGADVTTRYGVIKAGRNSVSDRPDHLIWNGEKLLEFEDSYVAVEQVFQMSAYDVALISQNAGGSLSVSSYSFLIVKPNGEFEILTDDEMHSDDGTVEVSHQGDAISINFGYSRGLQRIANLDGMQLVIVKRKPEKPVSLTRDECEMLYRVGLNECREIPEKDACSKAVSSLSYLTQSWLGGASQKPGFDMKAYEALCKRLCVQNDVVERSAFESQFCVK